LNKTTVATCLADEGLDPTCRRVLEIRASGAAAAAKKIYTLIGCACSDNRIRGSLQFHGSSTGRWSGRLLQPQNLKRVSLTREELEQALTVLGTGDYNAVREAFPDKSPLWLIGQCTQLNLRGTRTRFVWRRLERHRVVRSGLARR
jgi:DNA polymerase bacteriophage-type